MLTGFIALPMPLRLLIVVAISMLVARFINWSIYSFAYNARSLGPWSKAQAVSNTPRNKAGGKSKKSRASQLSPRTWLDKLPIVGWYRLRGEEQLHGKWYWVRPLLIELLFPLAMAWYYHFYVSGGALPLGPVLRAIAPELHWQFLAHFLLFSLMSIGTFIDFDEQSIPDLVTIPGTILGLVGAAFAPAWLPFHLSRNQVAELHACLPRGWPEWLDGPWGLTFGLLIVVAWGFALLERRVITRRGAGNAIRYFIARMFRNTILWRTVVASTAALIALVLVSWYWQNQLMRWPFFLSSLFGLAFAGGLTWAARIAATYGLQKEALGFGDVTLMAMIGVYIGWQPSLLVFFIAPLVAIIFVVVRALITGLTDTPYGPYLCAATALLLVYWKSLWIGWASPVFILGGLIVGIVATCIVLMGVLLWIWRLIKQGVGLG